MLSKQTTSDFGVSPVVGVILVVAITVVLSASVAAFVLDLGGNVSENPNAAVNMDYNGSAVTATVISPGNADSISISGAGSHTFSTVSAGDSHTFTSVSEGDSFTVTATTNGKTAVIQTYEA